MHKREFLGFTQASACPRKCAMKMKDKQQKNDVHVKMILMEGGRLYRDCCIDCKEPQVDNYC